MCYAFGKYWRRSTVDKLNGKILKHIQSSTDRLVFITDKNEKYLMFHQQDCCEDVQLEDVNGDLDDLLGVPILDAREEMSQAEESTWTFPRGNWT